ncbi:MAG: DUF2059 domain-containing protein [Nitrospiria bacterium]
MAKFAAVIILLSLVSCATTSSQDSRLSEARTKLAAEELARVQLKHGSFDVIMDTASNVALLAVRPNIENKIGRELSRSEDKDLNALFRKVFVEVFPEEVWIEAFRDIYTRFYTTEELEAILEFYGTRAGQRLLELNATVTNESKAAGERLVNASQEVFVSSFVEEFKKALPSLYSELERIGEDERALNIAETIQACKNIQESPDIPIVCQFEYVRERPTIFVTFLSLETAQRLWEAMFTHVAGPFCISANLVHVFINTMTYKYCNFI